MLNSFLYAVALVALCTSTVQCQTDGFRERWNSSFQEVHEKIPERSIEYPLESSWLKEFLTPCQEEKPAWEKLLYLAGASVGFAAFDYVGFNAVRKKPDALVVYRVVQVMAQAGITYYLYKNVGMSTAIAFNLVWWTFGTDIMYYGFAEVVNPGHPWESRGDFRHNVIENKTTWAYWTPLGILRGMKRDRPIAGDALIAQALTGAVLAVTIAVTW